jgi:putative DNA methylase
MATATSMLDAVAPQLTSAMHFSRDLPFKGSLLETNLPYRELSLIARADRRAVDPVYATHKWWARRPPGVIRGLLLAASLPADTRREDFWKMFSTGEKHLDGFHVHDMFAGGGAMLVEAARLGAAPSGTDVDPLAVEIIKHELQPGSGTAVDKLLCALLKDLKSSCANLFPSVTKAWTPLHYFYLHKVCCPKCETEGFLYKSLVIGRDMNKHGGVVRTAPIIAFCPDCLKIHELRRKDQRKLDCCKSREIYSGPFVGGRYVCGSCGHKSDHTALKTGASERQLIAVEETSKGQKRRIRKPRELEFKALGLAMRYIRDHRSNLNFPACKLSTARTDSRPVSFGITKASQLFTARQLAVFGRAFKWVETASASVEEKRALRLALSNALTTNNRLCSYATDYGRLAPLFSVRSYSLPWLVVELNPFHADAGRGTLVKAFNKIRRSSKNQARRYVWSVQKRRPVPMQMSFLPLLATPDIRCVSAARQLKSMSPVDVCIFDPPYFDYIAYSELSEFYRVWHDQSELGGKPLLPNSKDPVTSFGRGLGNCLKQTIKVLRPNCPMAFTFHSLSQDAWSAIAVALEAAELRVTALWPVLNDSHMGHHGAEGNCEWDLIVVCRRDRETSPAPLAPSISNWANVVKPLRIRKADRKSISMAIASLAGRFGKIARREHDQR